MDSTVLNAAIADIVAQHVDEASFLWCQRLVGLRSTSYSLRTLAWHDKRIEAHLDGLRIAGSAAVEACNDAVSGEEKGAIFVAGVLAIEGRFDVPVDALYARAQADSDAADALLSAFGWVSGEFLRGIVKELLDDATVFRRVLGVACCAMHGVDPGTALRDLLKEVNAPACEVALETAGRLARADLYGDCERALTAEDYRCRSAAARSLLLLGDRGEAFKTLRRLVLGTEPTDTNNLFILLQAAGLKGAHEILQELRGNSKRLYALVRGSGVAGDPSYIPWLIDLMCRAGTARFAGEAFTLITGADLSMLQLDRNRPNDFEGGPSDDPNDPNVDMDQDEGLPWPDPQKIEEWWAANSNRFQKGQRYFLGQPVTREHCIHVLRNGYQRQRILAAHYLCLLEPGTPLFNTSAPAWRQQRWLAKM